MKARWQLLSALMIGVGLGWVIAGPGQGAGREERPRHATKSERQPDRRSDRRAIPAEVRALSRPAIEGNTTADRMRAAIELANRIPVDQIEAWLDKSWFDPENGRVEMVYYDILYARFLEADPERFMKRCLRKEIDRVGEYMALWTQRDPHGAESFVRSLQDPDELRRVGGAFLSELGETNPAAALKLMDTWATRSGDSYWLNDALGRIARTHRAALLEKLASWPSSLREKATVQVGSSWLQDDYRGALDWMATLPDGAKVFAESLGGSSELADNLREHLHELPAGWIDRAIQRAGYNLVRSDPMSWLTMDADALGATENNVRQLQNYAASRLANDAKSRGEALALVAAGTSVSSEVRQRLVRSLIGSWDRNDVTGAQAWLAGLGSDELSEAGREALQNLQNPSQQSDVRRGPEAIIEQLAAEDEGRLSGNYQMSYWTAPQLEEARAAFSGLAAAERDRVAERLVSHGGNEVAPALMGEALNHLLRTAPVDLEKPAENRREVLKRLARNASQWGGSDPRAAAEWAEGVPDPEARELAARNVYLAWSRFEPEEARRWLDGIGVRMEPSEAGER